MKRPGRPLPPACGRLPSPARGGLFLALLLIGGLARGDRSFDVGPGMPASDAYGMVLVEGAETPQRWELDTALRLGYDHAPLHLRMSDANGKPFDTDFIRGQVFIDLGLSLGLWDFLAIGGTLPVAAQWYDDAAVGDPTGAPGAIAGLMGPPTMPTGIYRGQPRQNVGLSQAGPRDPRLLVKARLYHQPRFALGLLLAATLPLGNADSFLGAGGATFRPLIMAEGNVIGGRLRFLANLGAIVRGSSTLSDPGGAVLLYSGHELTFAAGAALRAHKYVSAGLEMSGTAPLTGAPPSKALAGDSAPPQAQAATIDLLGTISAHPTEGLRISLGAGGGLVPGPLRDVAQVFCGVAWSPSPRVGGMP